MFDEVIALYAFFGVVFASSSILRQMIAVLLRVWDRAFGNDGYFGDYSMELGLEYVADDVRVGFAIEFEEGGD